MNRFQKKCVILSIALHALLVGILLFGSAFFNPSARDESHTLLTAFDPSMVNALLTKGGDPNVAVVPPPAAAPNKPAQSKLPDPPKTVEPPEPKRVVHDDPEPPVKRKTDDDAPKIRRKETLTADDLKLNKSRPTKTRRQQNQSDSEAKQYADARREAKEFASSIRSLSKQLSTSTVDALPGPGGGGPLSAAFRDILASTYNAAWSSPPDLSDETAKVTISVTVARDGRVVNGRIVNPSHNAAMDRSIQNLLDTVTFIAPFPEGWNESERPFEIILSLRTKH